MFPNPVPSSLELYFMHPYSVESRVPPSTPGPTIPRTMRLEFLLHYTLLRKANEASEGREGRFFDISQGL